MKTLKSWIGILAIVLSPTSFAGVIAGWEFTNSGQVVDPSENVEIKATFYNSEYSSDVFSLSSLVGGFMAWDMNTIGAYKFNLGKNGVFFSQFQGVELNPGESYEFVFGSFSPKAEAVSEGTYGLSIAGLFSRGFKDFYVAGPFEFSVVQQTVLTLASAAVEVSEPSSLVILAMLLLVLARRFRAR